MKMKKFKLSNNFHNTETAIIAPASCENAIEAWCWLQSEAYRLPSDPNAKRRLRRIHNVLCGADNCKCGVVRM